MLINPYDYIDYMNLQIYKLVVLGQGRVGKTSISVKYVNNNFEDGQDSTINASYLDKKIVLENKQQVKLAIWDTAGQEKYSSIASVYYKEAMGAIIVYEITSKDSFLKVKKWVSELEMNAPKGIVLTIAGNKADLESQRVVNNAEVEKYAKQHNASHFLVSAKNGMNINELFSDLSERICKGNSDSKPEPIKSRINPKLHLDKTPPPSSNKSCCS